MVSGYYSYEPLSLFQLFQLKNAIEIYEDGMNLLQNGKVGLGGGGGASIYTCYMPLCRVGFQAIFAQ